MDLQVEPVPEKKRVLTSFEIGALKGPWEEYCKRNNVDSGPALCQIIQKLTGADPALLPVSARKKGLQPTRPERPYTSRETVEKKSKADRLEIQLKPSEREAINARAAADGFDNANAWVVALVRARLTNEPQFGSREIDLLGESNHQLLAIGRNLNQIAHALNATKGKSPNAYDVALVEELAEAVRRHVRKVGDALRASIHRWTLE